MASVGAQGEKMITELLRYFRNSLYWITIGAGLSFRAVLAYLDRLHLSTQFWELSSGFWNKIGSVTKGFLIILVLIHLFSVDREKGTLPVISSTVHGRGRLFRNRLVAGSIAVTASVFALSIGNWGITVLLGRGLSPPTDWEPTFLLSSVVAMMGAIGFFLISAAVCDLTQNQPAAMCICGLPFAVSYFVNSSVVKPLDLFWFFRYGFFTELMRGREIASLPIFWMIWYPLLIACIILLTVKKRKERKEL